MWAFVAKRQKRLVDNYIGSMQKGNTLFYHDHIQSNIAKLEERKDKFVQHRMEFLKEYCEPIQENVREIYSEVKRYKTMRDTQEEVIENE